MAYIGQEPVNTFSPVPSKDSFTGDGSTTTFDLQNPVVNGGENPSPADLVPTNI